MPTKTKPQDILDRISWVKELPEGGGSWGMGITGTAEALAREVVDLEKTKANIAEDINKRLRVLRTLPGRADREAPMMYSEDDVSLAKMSVSEAVQVDVEPPAEE